MTNDTADKTSELLQKTETQTDEINILTFTYPDIKIVRIINLLDISILQSNENEIYLLSLLFFTLFHNIFLFK